MLNANQIYSSFQLDNQISFDLLTTKTMCAFLKEISANLCELNVLYGTVLVPILYVTPRTSSVALALMHVENCRS